MASRIGIALGSGAARGWAHIGVMRTLSQAGIVPDVVCGTSIGAVVGGLALSGHLDNVEAWSRRLSKVSMGRLFDFQFGAGGIISGKRILHALEACFRDTMIEDLKGSFACVATDLDSGHEVWLRSGRIMDAVRASYAIPGIFPPVARHDRWLVDGALVNPIPVSLCHALGAEVTIAVDLRADRFGPEPGDDDKLELPQRSGLAGDENGRGFVRSYFKQRNGGPSAFGVFTRSLQIIQDRIGRARLAEDPPDVIISPSLRTVGALEFYRADECIAAGADAAQRALPAIHAAIRAAAQAKPPARAPAGAHVSASDAAA
jgi:NTE family protein